MYIADDQITTQDTPEEHREEMTVAELRSQLEEWDEDVFKMERRLRAVLRQHTRAHGMVAAFLHEVYALALRYDRRKFWKTRAQWHQEYGFTRWNVETAHRVLTESEGEDEEGLGVIRISHGVGNRTYYELLPARFLQVFYGDQDATWQPSTPGSDAGFTTNRTRGYHQQNEVLPPSHFADSEETYEKEEERRPSAPASASASARRAREEKAEELDAGVTAPDNGSAAVGEAHRERDHGPLAGGNADEAAQPVHQAATAIVAKVVGGVRAKWGEELPDDRRRQLRQEVEALVPEVRAELPARDDRTWVWKYVMSRVVDNWLSYEASGDWMLRPTLNTALAVLSERRDQERRKAEEAEQLVRECLEELREIEGWSWSDEKTLRWLRELREEFPLADPLDVCSALCAYYDSTTPAEEKRSLWKLRAFFKAGHNHAQERNGTAPVPDWRETLKDYDWQN